MKSDSGIQSNLHTRPFLAIAVGGLIAGGLDLAYAILAYTPTHPILIPQTIASGILGRRSYVEGAQSAALGVFLQFVIAFGAAAVFYAASRKLAFLVRHAVFSGLVYGALVFLFMHGIVLPLSSAARSTLPVIYKIVEFIEHWFLVGLPIALSVRHYSGLPLNHHASGDAEQSIV